MIKGSVCARWGGVILLALLSGSLADAASFDCMRAITSIEHAICARQDLSEWDSRLGDVFRKALSLQADHRPLLRDQNAWLVKRNAACGPLGVGDLERCLLEQFKDRIAILSSKVSQAGAKPNAADVWANIPANIPSGSEPPKVSSSPTPVTDPAAQLNKDTGAQSPVPPEVVRLENMTVEDDIRTVYLGNSDKHYVLFCNIRADGCITPEENKNYLLFNGNTRWKMPGAKDFLTLAFMQDWTVKYNQGENIGLISEDKSSGIGVFVLDKTGGGYERDTIFADGPIIYGAGMNDADRRKAWKHFFTQMVEAVLRQQGQDALGVKLAKRCLPGQNFCTTSLDANFVGIGGIQEPRKVAVIVATDTHDPNLQVMRMVCTWPTKGKQVCRDWDTGKLIPDNGTQ
jgi:uncharacterized protein